ncbi:MAG: tyrosine-type recombinase/integrase [Myxococcota bacterium]
MKWSLEGVSRAKGTYYRLNRGRRQGRIKLALAYVDVEAAKRALVRIQIEQDHGSIARVLELHQDRPSAALTFLMDDGGLELADVDPDYATWSLEAYVEQIYGPWRSNEAPRTWRSERGYWTRIVEQIGDVPVGKVSPFLVADLVDGLMVVRGPRKGESASGNYKRLVRAAIQACLMYAYRRQHIATKPDLGIFRIKGSTRGVKAKVPPLTLDELRGLLEVSDPMHRVMWAVGVGLGLRPAELVQVHWEDVDWDERLLDVRGTKTELSSETIPLTPIAHAHLRDRWEATGRPASGHVFRGRRGPYGPQGYRKALTRCVTAAGITRHVTPNLLRHSFATIAWSLGIKLDVARRVMRHASEAMLKKVYERPPPSHLVDHVKAFALV